MYKNSNDLAAHRSRTGSHSTKASARLSGSSDAVAPLRQIERMSLEQAHMEQARLKERFHFMWANNIGGEERRRIELSLGHLKHHIGFLYQIADATEDYSTLLRAVNEICDSSTAAMILARKLQIQSECGNLADRPKSSGRRRKPVVERTGGTMEQELRKALNGQTPEA